MVHVFVRTKPQMSQNLELSVYIASDRKGLKATGQCSSNPIP